MFLTFTHLSFEQRMSRFLGPERDFSQTHSLVGFICIDWNVSFSSGTSCWFAFTAGGCPLHGPGSAVWSSLLSQRTWPILTAAAMMQPVLSK